MSRVSREQQDNPDERSSWNRWAPLGIIVGVVVAIGGLIALLELFG